MDSERETLHNRLTNKHRSHASELAWKRHHGKYMQGMRKRQRDNLRSIYDLDKDESMDIEELNRQFREATIEKDNVFEKTEVISFENLAGGITLSVGDDNIVNLTTSLEKSGCGSYKSSVELDDAGLQSLYSEFKDELKMVCDNLDKEIQQLLAKHGLKPTE